MQNGVMYPRIIKIPHQKKSCFLFGPRGTGKTWWLRNSFPNAIYLDLLESDLYVDLLANPQKLETYIPPSFHDWVIIDEVQRLPQLLNEVHRLIEKKRFTFLLTGSSSRSLRRKGVNLLGGRAHIYKMYPLTCQELGKDFVLQRSLEYGNLPAVYSESEPQRYLKAYIEAYIREEVLQEGLTRNIGGFARFLESASFSQGNVINMAEISREIGINHKTVESFFEITEDLLLSYRLTPFTKRAKRRVVSHPKFYFFDSGVFRTIRPMGPADKPEEAEGAALETLLFQELLAINDYFDLGYKLHFWRTSNQLEVDFILYGPKGIVACEVKRSRTISRKDLSGLYAFGEDYPEASLFLFSGTSRREYIDNIRVVPISEALQNLPQLLSDPKKY